MMIGAVLLAGGAGVRIGGAKPLQLLAGRRLIDHVLDRVRRWNLPCAIAVRGDRQSLLDATLPHLVDTIGVGPIAGLASALAWARHEGLDAILTLPCDTPFLPDDLVQRLQSEGRLASAAVARSGEQVHPACGLWRTGVMEALADYVETRRSLKGFAEILGARIVDWPIRPHDPFFNVNTSDDLEAAARILKSR